MAEKLITHTVWVDEDDCRETIEAFEADGWAVRQVVPIPDHHDEWPCHAMIIFEKWKEV